MRVYRCLAEELAFHRTEQVVQKIAFNLVSWNEAHDAVWEACLKVEDGDISDVGSYGHDQSANRKHSAYGQTLLVQGLPVGFDDSVGGSDVSCLNERVYSAVQRWVVAWPVGELPSNFPMDDG